MVRALCLGLFLSTSLMAQDTLLKCLGREEAQLFKTRSQGSIATLNQDLVLEFIQFSDYQPLIRRYFLEVCASNSTSPAFKLLKILFLHQAAIFKKPNATETIGFMRKVPGIFLKLIAQVKTYGEDLECVHRVLPELKKLDQIILSYQQEKSNKLLFYQNPLATKVLSRLPTVLPRLRACQRKKANAPPPVVKEEPAPAPKPKPAPRPVVKEEVLEPDPKPEKPAATVAPPPKEEEPMDEYDKEQEEYQKKLEREAEEDYEKLNNGEDLTEEEPAEKPMPKKEKENKNKTTKEKKPMRPDPKLESQNPPQ